MKTRNYGIFAPATGYPAKSLSGATLLFVTLDVVVVYQCFISNVMYTGDIEALFVFGSHCVRLLGPHPLLHGTYPIINPPWPGLAGSHIFWHFTYKCHSTTYYWVGLWNKLDLCFFGRFNPINITAKLILQ